MKATTKQQKQLLEILVLNSALTNRLDEVNTDYGLEVKKACDDFEKVMQKLLEKFFNEDLKKTNFCSELESKIDYVLNKHIKF